MSIVEQIQAPQVAKTAAQEAAERGAAFLDERLPGWAEHIDLERLDVSSGCNCVLGQAYRDAPSKIEGNGFVRGTDWLDVHGDTCARLGFINQEYGYPELTEAWADEIKKRIV